MCWYKVKPVLPVPLPLKDSQSTLKESKYSFIYLNYVHSFNFSFTPFGVIDGRTSFSPLLCVFHRGDEVKTVELELTKACFVSVSVINCNLYI